MISEATIERVRETADIVSIIGEYVELKRQGADYRGPCPFHQGTHRNFSVSAKKQMYYCFVCHESGDVFKFLTARLGVDWPTAVRMVAEKSGVDVVETQSHRSPDEKDDREPFWEVNGAAAEYFRRTLWEDELGREARAYVEQREVTRDLADRVGLGFAPREIGLMRAYLNALGFEDERLVQAGLLVTPEGATDPRPRFRGRLIFPIYDVSSHVVGFGGRLLGPGEPKYLNSAESPVFSKGKLLYGLNWAKQAARRDERMLVVEGYFDAMRLMGAGVESVVAPMGTALTEDQAKLIRRYTDRVFLLYDSDKAGLKATFRSGDELLRQGASVQVVTLPEGDDPDTFVRVNGARGLEAQLATSIDVFERKIQILERGGWFADLRKKRQALDRLLPTLRATSDPLTRSIYLEHMVRVSGVSQDAVIEEMQRTVRRQSRDTPFLPRGIAETAEEEADMPLGSGAKEVAQRRKASNTHPTEKEFVRVLVHRPWLIERVAERVGSDELTNALTRRIYSAMLEVGADPSHLAAKLDAESTGLLQELLNETEGLDSAERTLEGVMGQLAGAQLRVEIAELQRQQSIASDAENTELLREITRLSKERRAAGGRVWYTGTRSAGAGSDGSRRS